MKTLKHFSIAFALLCCSFIANAQCGVNAYWGYTINPNHVHVFADSSVVTSGWQISQHYWSFGDGSTSNLANPTHQYANPGNYHVCEYVIAQEIGGTTTCTDTFCHDVSNCNGMVQASATASVNGNYVIYAGTGSSNYPPLTYSWTFPGGTPSTSTTATTTVYYPNTGTHQGCLIVTDANGCSADACQNATTASVCGNANASFASTTTG